MKLPSHLPNPSGPPFPFAPALSSAIALFDFLSDGKYLDNDTSSDLTCALFILTVEVIREGITDDTP